VVGDTFCEEGGEPATLGGLVDDVADRIDNLLRSVRESGY
jgi:hypothetical protein